MSSVQLVPGLYIHTVVLESPELGEHNSAELDFADYSSALNAGTLALAAADEQPYENEAADPVNDAGCAG